MLSQAEKLRPTHQNTADGAAPPDPSADAPELCGRSVAELLDLYRTGRVSPVEVVQASLRRADEVQAAYNAFTLIDHEGALEAARRSEERWRKQETLGPLDGIPATLKDILSARSWPSRLGSKSTSATPATEDAPAAKLLREAGAIAIGQTTSPEFGWKAVTDSPLFGVTRNPWNPALTPGGSSGGAAVAAATSAGLLHLGSDGGGSIRVPAAFSGVFGHKPSFGRVPYFPSSAFGTVSHLGPLTRRVEDAAVMLDVLSRRDLRDWNQNPLAFAPVTPIAPPDWRRMRIGLWRRPLVGSVHAEIDRATERAATSLEAAGAQVEEIALPAEDDLLDLFNTMWFVGAANRIRDMSRETIEAIDPGFVKAARIGARVSAIDLAHAGVRRSNFGMRMDALLSRFDLVISPATAIPAFEAGHNVPPDSGLTWWTEWASFSFPLNLSQQPACSVPNGLTSDGRPIGLQIIGPRGQDATVIRAAAAFAQMRGADA